MPRASRASQFMPFAALKGFDDALRTKEKIIVPKADLTEDALEYLDYQINLLTIGALVEVTYYDGENYIKKCGMISKINKKARFLTVVTTDISFDDIKDIRV